LQFSSGAIDAGCHHDSCKGKDWHALRNIYEPGWDQKHDKARSDRQQASADYFRGSEARDNPEPPALCPEHSENPSATAAAPHGLLLTRLSDVKPQPIDWLWRQRFALGKIAMVCGDPGLGKSFITIDIAARITTGSPWPDLPHDRTVPGSVILCNAEDDLADTIRPRLDAAGADASRVVSLRGMRRPAPDGKTTIQSFTLAELPMLREALQATPDARAVIIDPVSAYLSDADSHKNAEIRGLLAPLADMAAEFRVAVILITHLNKAAGGKSLHRAMGSLAFVAAARSAWLVTADQADPSRRLFLPMKNNLGNDSSGLAYSIMGEDQQARVIWEREPVTMKADEALASADDESSRPGPDAYARNAAVEWVSELLADGAMESAKVKAEAGSAGLSWATVRRAQVSIGIKPFKDQFGGVWMWKLPPAKTACAPTCSPEPPSWTT
jgi:putative DNA primase/helicase